MRMRQAIFTWRSLMSINFAQPDPSLVASKSSTNPVEVSSGNKRRNLT
jgi:hypothetical protein